MAFNLFAEVLIGYDGQIVEYGRVAFPFYIMDVGDGVFYNVYVVAGRYH